MALTLSLKRPQVFSTPQEFAEVAIELYRNQSKWQQSADAAARVIGQRFACAEHQHALSQKVAQVLARLEQHRLNNFYGSMMRHHSLKSSQYMSQWIEAKNQLKNGNDVTG